MQRLFTILADGVERFESFVDEFRGDGIMALFGAPIAHEDHAHRACHAALHLRDEIARYADELRRSGGIALSVRMGLDAGAVVVGKIADDLRMDYTAHGRAHPARRSASRRSRIRRPGDRLSPGTRPGTRLTPDSRGWYAPAMRRVPAVAVALAVLAAAAPAPAAPASGAYASGSCGVAAYRSVGSGDAIPVGITLTPLAGAATSYWAGCGNLDLFRFGAGLAQGFAGGAFVNAYGHASTGVLRS